MGGCVARITERRTFWDWRGSRKGGRKIGRYRNTIAIFLLLSPGHGCAQGSLLDRSSDGHVWVRDPSISGTALMRIVLPSSFS